MKNLKDQLIKRGLPEELLKLTDTSIKKLKDVEYNIMVDLETPLNYLHFCCHVFCVYFSNYAKKKLFNINDCVFLGRLSVKDFDKFFPNVNVDDCFKMSYITTANTLYLGVDDTADLYIKYLTGKIENTFHEKGVLHLVCEVIEEYI